MLNYEVSMIKPPKKNVHHVSICSNFYLLQAFFSHLILKIALNSYVVSVYLYTSPLLSVTSCTEVNLNFQICRLGLTNSYFLSETLN